MEANKHALFFKQWQHEKYSGMWQHKEKLFLSWKTKRAKQLFKLFSFSILQKEM